MPAKETLREFLVPVAILAICTALIAVSGLDLTLEGHFYQQGVWV